MSAQNKYAARIYQGRVMHRSNQRVLLDHALNRIPVPVRTLQKRAISSIDALDDTLRGLDIEATGGTHGGTSDVSACLLA